MSSDGLPCTVIRNDRPDRPIIFFVAGFPDNQTSALHPTVMAELSKDYNLVCLCFPGYEKDNRIIRSWGYDMDELLSLLDGSIKIHSKQGQQVYLLAHDWGAYLSIIYCQKNPNRIQKIMLLDVGVLDIKSISLRAIFIIILYQWWFSVAYIVSQLLGHLAGMLILGLYYLPIFKPFYPTIDERPDIPRQDMRVEKCYPYLYFWKNTLMGRKDMEPRTPTIPTLFLYGNKKNVMFHSQKFLEKLDSRADCRQTSVDGGKSRHHIPCVLSPCG